MAVNERSVDLLTEALADIADPSEVESVRWFYRGRRSTDKKLA